MKKSLIALLMSLVLVVTLAAPASAGGLLDKFKTLKEKIESAIAGEEETEPEPEAEPKAEPEAETEDDEDKYAVEKAVKKLLIYVEDQCKANGIEPEEALDMVMTMVTDKDGNLDLSSVLGLIGMFVGGEGMTAEAGEEEIAGGGYIEMLRNRAPVLKEYIINEHADALEPGDVQLVSYPTVNNDEDDPRYVLGYFTLLNFTAEGRDLKFKNSASSVEYLVFETDENLQFTLAQAYRAEDGEKYSESVDKLCEMHKVTREKFNDSTSETQKDWDETATLMYFLQDNPDYDRIEYKGELKTYDEMSAIYDEIFDQIMEEAFAALGDME